MRNEIALQLKKSAVKILRLVIPQQILTFVMTSIVFDNSADHAKLLSIFFFLPEYRPQLKLFFQCVTIA